MIYAYAKVENGQIVEYPVYEGDLKTQCGYTDTSAIAFSPPDGYVVVYDAPYPDVQVDYNQTIVDDTPKIIDNEWTRVWTIRDATAEELDFRIQRKSSQVRKLRNQYLSETDWTQVADSPVDSRVWAEYRKKLRDVPQQAGFPWETEWPEKPV